MYGHLKDYLTQELNSIREAGLYKTERIIQSPQGAEIKVPQGEVLNFCANNYLGLGDHPDLIAAAKDALDRWGYGMSSVRFICGTQEIHRQLEKKIAEFLGMDDSILYSSCFDANGGLFETLMKEEDAIITDSLNHASIIDGVRLSKAKRSIYKHADMEDLEARLKEAQDTRFRLVVTDGVFSMDGDIAKLPEICDLVEKYNAILMVDDSHSTGFMPRHARILPRHGTSRYYHVYSWQGAWRSLRRLHMRAAGDCGYAAAEVTALSLLKYASAADCRIRIADHYHALRKYRTARQAGKQHHLFPREDDGSGIRHSSRYSSDRPDHAL
jgi:hypothetical protein